MPNFEKRKNSSNNCQKHSGNNLDVNNLTREILEKVEKLNTIPNIRASRYNKKCPICAYEKGYQDALENTTNISSNNFIEEFDFNEYNKKESDFKKFYNNIKCDNLKITINKDGNKVAKYKQKLSNKIFLIFEVFYNIKKQDIDSFTIYKTNINYDKINKMVLSKFTFLKIKDFLEIVNKISFDKINEKITIENLFEFFNNEKLMLIKNILSNNYGDSFLEELSKGNIKEEDIKNKEEKNILNYCKTNNFSYTDVEKKFLQPQRENSLVIFKDMLVNNNSDEKLWQNFFKENHWILGLNTGIKFINELEIEANIGVANTNNIGSAHADYIGWNDYTLLIELKTPLTSIFTQKKQNTARTNTWSFSNDFIDGISQCLAQKSSLIENISNKNIVDGNGNVIDKNKIRTQDPKIIFIIGNKYKELTKDLSNVDTITKRDTFERFKANNKHIDIITYDELYERAFYIVYNRLIKQEEKPIININRIKL